MVTDEAVGRRSVLLMCEQSVRAAAPRKCAETLLLHGGGCIGRTLLCSDQVKAYCSRVMQLALEAQEVIQCPL